MKSKVAQSCPTLCSPTDYSLPCFSVHGIFQARVLEWVAISFSRGSSRPRDRTRVFRIAGRRFTIWATKEAFKYDVNCRFVIDTLYQAKEMFFCCLLGWGFYQNWMLDFAEYFSVPIEMIVRFSVFSFLAWWITFNSLSLKSWTSFETHDWLYLVWYIVFYGYCWIQLFRIFIFNGEYWSNMISF